MTIISTQHFSTVEDAIVKTPLVSIDAFYKAGWDYDIRKTLFVKNKVEYTVIKISSNDGIKGINFADFTSKLVLLVMDSKSIPNIEGFYISAGNAIIKKGFTLIKIYDVNQK